MIKRLINRRRFKLAVKELRTMDRKDIPVFPDWKMERSGYAITISYVRKKEGGVWFLIPVQTNAPSYFDPSSEVKQIPWLNVNGALYNHVKSCYNALLFYQITAELLEDTINRCKGFGVYIGVYVDSDQRTEAERLLIQ